MSARAKPAQVPNLARDLFKAVMLAMVAGIGAALASGVVVLLLALAST